MSEDFEALLVRVLIFLNRFNLYIRQLVDSLNTKALLFCLVEKTESAEVSTSFSNRKGNFYLST